MWLPLLADLYRRLVLFAGRLIAVGGMTSERMRLASVEALDPREPHGWSPLPSMSTARCNSPACLPALKPQVPYQQDRLHLNSTHE